MLHRDFLSARARSFVGVIETPPRVSLGTPGGRRPRARRRQRVAPPASRSAARVARAARRRPVRQTARAVPSGHVPRARPGTPLGARGGFVRHGAPRRRRPRVWASRLPRVLLPGPPRRWPICDGEFLPEYNDFAIFIETPSILARFAENIPVFGTFVSPKFWISRQMCMYMYYYSIDGN